MMHYTKIQSIYKRDEKTHKFLMGEYTLPEFKYLENNVWSWSEKVDGVNCRVQWNGETIIFGGKTAEAQISAKLVEELQRLFPVDKFKELYPETTKELPMTLYGEGYGPGIQKVGKLYKDNQSFVLFDVLIHKLWLERHNVDDVANKLGITSVPIIGEGTIPEMVEIVKTGFKSQWGYFTAEGIVARPKVEMFNRKGERVITKVKHKDFLK